jgi:hypothetical protein
MEQTEIYMEHNGNIIAGWDYNYNGLWEIPKGKNINRKLMDKPGI